MLLYQRCNFKEMMLKKIFLSVVCIVSFIPSVFATESFYRAIKNNTLKENTTYSVSRKVNLKGQEILIPQGCTLDFRKKGRIINGTVNFASTTIQGDPKFVNCCYEGNIFISEIDDRCFDSEDDTRTLKFLLSNAITNGCKCDIYRDYRISMKDATGLGGVVSVHSLDSGAEIDFRGHTIYNTFVFHSDAIKPVIVLTNVKGVTIRNCNFRDPDEHNTHRFKESAGSTFIQCYGDCESINLLNCTQENGDCILRSGVWVHNENRPYNTPSRGLCNSTIKVSSNNVGYGLALYCADSLDVDITVMNPHRGFYCAGVSNSKIRYRGYNPQETKTHILIKDAVYIKNVSGKEVLDMKGCDHLDINAVVDEILPGERVFGFQSYGYGLKEGADFRFRSTKCHHHDISVTATIVRSPEKGFFHICDNIFIIIT